MEFNTNDDASNSNADCSTTNSDHDDELVVSRYLSQMLKCISDCEEVMRQQRLTKAYWSTVTPALVNQIVLQSFLKNTECLNRGDHFTTEEPPDHPTDPNNARSSPDSFHHRPPDQLSVNEYHPVDEPDDPSIQYELEQRLAEAAQVQHLLCPILIRFWQTIPQQLRQKVKTRVADALRTRVTESHSQIDSSSLQSKPPSALQSTTQLPQTNTQRRKALLARLADVPEAFPFPDPYPSTLSTSSLQTSSSSISNSQSATTIVIKSIIHQTAVMTLCNRNAETSRGEEAARQSSVSALDES